MTVLSEQRIDGSDVVAVVVGQYYAFDRRHVDGVATKHLRDTVGVDAGVYEETAVAVTQIGAVAAAAAGNC